MSNFHQLIWYLYIFFDDLVVQFSCPFKNSIVFLSLSFENSILNTSSSSDIWLASIFKVQKLLNFGKVSYQLLLWSMLLVLYLRNLCLTQGHRHVFSRSFTVLTFRSRIHFKLVFVDDARYELKFTFFSFLYQICWKDQTFQLKSPRRLTYSTIFSALNYLWTFVANQLYIFMWFYLGTLFSLLLICLCTNTQGGCVEIS